MDYPNRTVNLSETLDRFARDGHDPEPVAAGISSAGITVVDFTGAQALICARLLPQARELGLSLGDRACVALAIERGTPAMTADRVWLKLDSQVGVRVIR
jgi:PIN domain nuclease of toxin-antitoxin system